MMPAMRVDHIGIAVESIADGEPFLELLGADKLVHELYCKDDPQHPETSAAPPPTGLLDRFHASHGPIVPLFDRSSEGRSGGIARDNLRPNES